MGTSLRSDTALQDSWDMALALGFGDLWEGLSLKTVTGGNNCFFPEDKLGST